MDCMPSHQYQDPFRVLSSTCTVILRLHVVTNNVELPCFFAAPLSQSAITYPCALQGRSQSIRDASFCLSYGEGWAELLLIGLCTLMKAWVLRTSLRAEMPFNDQVHNTLTKNVLKSNGRPRQQDAFTSKPIARWAGRLCHQLGTANPPHSVQRSEMFNETGQNVAFSLHCNLVSPS